MIIDLYIHEIKCLTLFALPIILYLIVPVIFISWIWNQTPKNVWMWAINSAIGGVYLADIYLTGAWPLLGLPIALASFFIILFVLAMIYSVFRIQKPKTPLQKKFWPIFGYSLLILFSGVLSWEVFSALKGKIPSEDTIALEFPLKNGSYYVLHGGNSDTINGHYAVKGQRFALDIVKLSGIGTHASKFIPSELGDYCIYSENLYSPVSGTVLKAVNDIDDSRGLNIDPIHPAGNHLIIRAKNTDQAVVLAHLKKGSLRVKEGDMIVAGQLIAEVGNSGNTSEPHLHIHTVKLNERNDFLFDAEPVSMIFNHKFLVRNDIHTSR